MTLKVHDIKLRNFYSSLKIGGIVDCVQVWEMNTPVQSERVKSWDHLEGVYKGMSRRLVRPVASLKQDYTPLSLLVKRTKLAVLHAKHNFICNHSDTRQVRYLYHLWNKREILGFQYVIET